MVLASGGAMRERQALLAFSAIALGAAAFVQLRSSAAERAHRIRGGFIDVNGARVHYLERGSGDALVLLHGLGSMIDDFVLSGLVSRAAEHYRVIAIDRPGYGRSSRPSDRRWTLAAQADLVHAALRRLDVQRPLLLGHSLGATVALAYALRHPVERLVLAAGVYYPSPRLDAPLLIPPAIPLIGPLLRYTVSPLLGRLLWRAWLRLIFSPAAVPRRFRPFPAWMALRPQTLRAIGEDARYLLPAVSAMAADYKRVRAPTTIIAGAHDRYVSARAHSTRLHAEIPGSELLLVPGAGHMLHHVAAEALFASVIGARAPTTES
ncbi:MAG: alpha/beta hydrolase [Betaproteobacteria bacterium]|nr:MAG: alpha/beta hydrolase [Betaproteobacteria bacterium]